MTRKIQPDSHRLFGFRIAPAVPRFVADIGMDHPAAQQSFFLHADFFQHAGGGEIFEVAHRPNAVDRWLSYCPIMDGAHGFCSITLVPIRARKDIAKFQTAIMDTRLDHSDENV